MRRTTQRGLFSAWMLAATLIAPRAFATEPTTAAEAFAAATDAFQRRAFAEAARLFEAAHRMQPAGAALFNAARAWISAGDRARAADALTGALAVGDFAPEERDKAERLLADLRKDLAEIRLDGPTGTQVAVGDLPPRPVPLATHVVPGRVRLAITDAGGAARMQEVEARAGERLRIELSAPAPPVASGPPTVAPPVTPPAPEESGPSPFVVAGVTCIAVGAGAGVATGVLGVMALSARDDFLVSDRTDVGARDRAATLRTATNVVWIAGAAVAATGIVLLVVEATRDDAPAVAVGLGPAGVRLDVVF